MISCKYLALLSLYRDASVVAKVVTHLIILYMISNIDNIKRPPINDRSLNYTVDQPVKITLNKLIRNNNPPNHHNRNRNLIILFYCNQMHNYYKQEKIANKNVPRRLVSSVNLNKYI